MKFCTKCGSQLEEGKQFCTKCGQPLSSGGKPVESTLPQAITQRQDTQQQVPTVAMELPNIKIKLSKLQKIIAMVVAIVIILGVGSYKVGESLTSRSKAVSKFNEAIASKKTSDLASYIISSDPKLKIDDSSINALLSYIDKNPSYKDKITKSIDNQCALMDKLPEIDGTLSGNTNDLFTIKKQGKTCFFYDKYVFELNPIYIRVNTNYKDTQIFLGNTLVCTADQEYFQSEIGPFVPGLYKMKALLNGQYVNIEKTIDIDLIKNVTFSNVNKNIKDEELDLQAQYVSISSDSSDYDDAKLFANGKDTGLKVKDASNFGPVSNNGSIKIYSEEQFPWGSIKSAEVALTGNTNIYLKLNGVNDELKNTLMETVNTYSKSVFDLYKTHDLSKLMATTESNRSSQSSLVQSSINGKYEFAGTLSKSVFDLDSVKIHKIGDKYSAEILTTETSSPAWYTQGTSAPTPTVRDQASIYYLTYDATSNKWLVSSSNSTYRTPGANIKQFTF